ncbi:MAG: hypothetical protein M1831_005445 [Alyxoria varia]|nr:MAG: hypothetical protein M1831_005445 [Alyxoria varia]
MGKPPRERFQIPRSRNSSHTSITNANSADAVDNRDNSGSHDNDSEGVNSNCGLFADLFDLSSVYGANGSSNDSLLTTDKPPSALQSNQPEPLMSSITSLDSSDNPIPMNMDNELLLAPDPTTLNGYASANAQSEAFDNQVDQGTNQLEDAFMQPESNKKHNCFRVAHDILGDLSCLDLEQNFATPTATSSTTTTTSMVPLDHILRLNRISSERLTQLLTCPCARSPSLKMIHASIISRILAWYQQAAGYDQRIAWDSSAVASDMGSCRMSSSESGSGPLTPWSSTASSMGSISRTSTPSHSEASGFTVAPTQMAIGSFNIDDQHLQSTLRVQLLFSEIKKTSDLINSFASQGFTAVDGFKSGAVDTLHDSLNSWIRVEYSRISDTMRSRLKEVINRC